MSFKAKKTQTLNIKRPDENLSKAQSPLLAGLKILDSLDASRIYETGLINKNRNCLIVFDREKKDESDWLEGFMEQVARALDQLYSNEIDTITIDVKQRTW